MSATSASVDASRGVPPTETTPAADLEVLGRRFHRVGGDLEDLARALRAPPRGAAPLYEHRAAAAARCPAERRRRGVALDDADVVDVDAERVGDHLRDRGLEALAVAGAPIDDLTCRRLDATRGALAASC